DARGVLAATFAAPRPRVVERVALPDCPEVIALDAETALCPSPSSLTAWRVAPQRRLWTQPIAIAGAVALGDRLVVAWDTRAELVLLDAATGAETERVRGLARIADVARALDGQRVIAHDGETVIAFAADGGARTVRRACGDRAVAAAATSTRDTYVVCARGELGRLADDGLASIAETGFGTEIPGATALAVSEDGLDLAIGSAAGDIQLVDGRGCFSAGCQGSRTLMLARILPGAIRRLAVLDPSGVLAIGDRGDAVRIRRGANAELSRLPITADRPITFLEGGDLVAGGAAWHRWAVDDAAPPARLVHDRGLRAAAIAADRRTAATITDDDELVIWDAARGTRTRTIAVPGARAVTLGPDGAEVVVTARDGAARYATATGARLGDARAPGTVAGALASATAGTSTWVVDGELRVWRVDGERVERAGAAVGAVAMAVSADGSTVATADRHRVAIGTVAIEVAGADVSALALSADGRRIALGTSTGRVEVWDVTTQHLLARLPAHAQRVAWLQLEGDRLWTAGDDGDLRWWALFALDASREDLVARSRASWGASVSP
ncbi:MAG: hypothetical protein JNL83_35770, partial [Myxococcales bacterium]|nr:hypothetical protein [Myxococcales bacterium]